MGFFTNLLWEMGQETEVKGIKIVKMNGEHLSTDNKVSINYAYAEGRLKARTVPVSSIKCFNLNGIN